MLGARLTRSLLGSSLLCGVAAVSSLHVRHGHAACPLRPPSVPLSQDCRGLRGRSVRLPGHDLDHPGPTIAQRVVGIEPLLPQAVAD
jgi:hypothetical protein